MPRCADRHSVRRCGQSLGLPHINTVTVVHKFPAVIAYRIPRRIAFHENLEEIQNVCIACRQAVPATDHHVSGQQALKQDNRLSHQLRQYRKATALTDGQLPQVQALIDCRKYRCQIFCAFHKLLYYHIVTFTLPRYTGNPIQSPPAQSTAMPGDQIVTPHPRHPRRQRYTAKAWSPLRMPSATGTHETRRPPRPYILPVRFAIPSTTRYFQP